MHEFIKKKELTALPTLKEGLVDVGGKPHMALGFSALNPDKFVMQDILTFQAKIKIQNEFYKTRRNYEEEMPIHPLRFEFEESGKVHVSYGSHQFTVPSLVEGKNITSTSIATLQKLGEYRLIQ